MLPTPFLDDCYACVPYYLSRSYFWLLSKGDKKLDATSILTSIAVWRSSEGDFRIFKDEITNHLTYEESGDGLPRIFGHLKIQRQDKERFNCWESEMYEDGEVPEYVGELRLRLVTDGSPYLEANIKMEGDSTWGETVICQPVDGSLIQANARDHHPMLQCMLHRFSQSKEENTWNESEEELLRIRKHEMLTGGRTRICRSARNNVGDSGSDKMEQIGDKLAKFLEKMEKKPEMRIAPIALNGIFAPSDNIRTRIEKHELHCQLATGDIVRFLQTNSELRGCTGVITQLHEASSSCRVRLLEKRSYGGAEHDMKLQDIRLESAKLRVGNRVSIDGMRENNARNFNGLVGRIIEPKGGHPAFIPKSSKPDQMVFTVCVQFDDAAAAGRPWLYVQPRFIQLCDESRRATGRTDATASTNASATPTPQSSAREMRSPRRSMLARLPAGFRTRDVHPAEIGVGAAEIGVGALRTT